MAHDHLYNTSTAKEEEILSFNHQAMDWWNENGLFKMLHRMNPVRLHFIHETLKQKYKTPEALKGLKVLDIGCGGGLLCEPFARLGATVTGIDASEKAIEIAKAHATTMGLSINYRCCRPEELYQELQGEKFDIVLALEIVEHVQNVPDFIKICCALTDSFLFLSTLNRTTQSFLGAIVGAEYILRWVPKGTHQWDQFLKPCELAQHLRSNGFHFTDLIGMNYNLLKKQWRLSKDLGINYLGAAQKI